MDLPTLQLPITGDELSKFKIQNSKFSLFNWSENILSSARTRVSRVASNIMPKDVTTTVNQRRCSLSLVEAVGNYFDRQNLLNTTTESRNNSSYSSKNDYSLSNILPSRTHSNRRSTQSLRTFRIFDLPISTSATKNDSIVCQAKKCKFKTTSFAVSATKCGSLESVDFDEDDQSAFSSVFESGLLCQSSGSSIDSTTYSSSLLPCQSTCLEFELTQPRSLITSSTSSTSSPLSSFSSSFSTSSSSSSFSLCDIKESYARAFGYASLCEIELYYRLHKMLESRRQNNQNEMNIACRWGCSKNVNRFGLGYKDYCIFPLFLPVFLNDCLQKKTKSYVTWEYIKLQADAELCRWEYSSLQNLSRKFPVAPITGVPSDNICPDPNLFLRNLCYQLVIERNFKSISNQERNRALKRWNSIDDIMLLTNKMNLEAEFIGNKKEKIKKNFTDETIGVISIWKFTKRAQTKFFFTKKLKNQNSRKANLISSNNNLFNDISSFVHYCKPVHLALYLTRLYLQEFRNGFDLQMLAQLVLVKDIASFNQFKVNQKLRQTLLNLLTLDDTIVAVMNAHFRQQSPIKEQAGYLASMIETACLLWQLQNFHGLKVLIGSLQSLSVYAMTDTWHHLLRNKPIHFRDYKRLCRFVRQLDKSILCTNKPHIPSLENLLNRLRLCCVVSWDLFEAKRRFHQHPSIADWLDAELLPNENLNVNNSSKIGSKKSFPHLPLFARLTYDSVAQSYLTATDSICLVNWNEFPCNWSRRYLPAMPERHLRKLLQTQAFSNMVDCFFQTPINQYHLVDI